MGRHGFDVPMPENGELRVAFSALGQWLLVLFVVLRLTQLDPLGAWKFRTLNRDESICPGSSVFPGAHGRAPGLCVWRPLASRVP